MTDGPQRQPAVLKGCIATNQARKIADTFISLIIFHLLRYLSVSWVPGLDCEPLQSSVWLLTLTFIGGSGGEGSAERKTLSREEWQK